MDAAAIILAVAALIAVLAVVEPLRSISGAVVTLLEAVANHRHAQATSVMHHTGLLERDE